MKDVLPERPLRSKNETENNLMEVGSTEVSKKLLWMMVPDYGTNVLVSLNKANLFSLQKRDKKICDQSSNLKLKRAYFTNMLNISKSAHYNSNGYGYC